MKGKKRWIFKNSQAQLISLENSDQNLGILSLSKSHFKYQISCDAQKQLSSTIKSLDFCKPPLHSKNPYQKNHTYISQLYI